MNRFQITDISRYAVTHVAICLHATKLAKEEGFVPEINFVHWHTGARGS